MSTKEQYWKYSLITIILVMGVVIFFKATPFLGGLLGAATIYIPPVETGVYSGIVSITAHNTATESAITQKNFSVLARTV